MPEKSSDVFDATSRTVSQGLEVQRSGLHPSSLDAGHQPPPIVASSSEPQGVRFSPSAGVRSLTPASTEVFTSSQEDCWIWAPNFLHCAPPNAETRIGLISKPQTPPFVGGRQGILQYPAFKAHFKYFVHDVLTCEATKLSILRSYLPQSVLEEIGESVLAHPFN